MRLLLACVALCLPLSAPAAETERDPWQGLNRGIFAFNETVDRWVAKPVARGYQWLAPEPVDHAVSNFFHNIGDVANLFNHALQGEVRLALGSTTRLVTNTSLGVGGLFDVATRGGVTRRTTDFGITLGKWGADSGPYLMLPLLGPATVRDVFRFPVDGAVSPLPEPWTAVDHDLTRASLQALEIVDFRADLLAMEESMVGDRYTFLRDVYLQRRDFQVHGAAQEDAFLDDDYGDDYGTDSDSDSDIAPAAAAETVPGVAAPADPAVPAGEAPVP